MTVTVVMKNKKEKFADTPNFTEKKDYRPSEVKETGLVFVGHEISEDRTVMNQFLHYDQLYTIRHGFQSAPIVGIWIVIYKKPNGWRCR